ncbi:hypothetical protein SAMD00019534_042150 [Acytostelium subglobosum LB1]|uniref:hypothetical protein n=1 Tax=Acytostelium subglobosum LB1 TaxID=1410327 RepID=UPI000644C702|nr:hypothetical protein SAMD00019534_042150 [Acytostelium subglobosum LB1]GAM21040.1 hypothetical protein SAMD00019534_042150 [Acytostelium subglobosum LB1]|eukprot:XP_012756174.1 hypothetical protein SAMD00019534_042150 [Acytostelium subglobosum LB1]
MTVNDLTHYSKTYGSQSDNEILSSGIFRRFFALPVPADPKVRHFSLFVDQDLENSDRLIKQMYALTTLSQLLCLAIDKISSPNVHPLLVKYSLAVAINHAPQFQCLKPQVPQALVIAPAHVFVDKNVPKRWKNPDSLLKWWREDPMLNSHHWNWHTAYPSFGVTLDGASPARLKDRQGELFVFMHRQMIARYDCERTALGLQPIDPFGSNSYRESLGDSFDPLISMFVARPADAKMRDLVQCTPPFDSISVVDLEIWRDRLYEAIQNRTFRKLVQNADGSSSTVEIPMTINDLGSSLEATMGSPNKSYYGNLNKQAHNLMSRVFDTQGEEQNSIGIMGDIIGAFRDPIFWRWHNHLDEFFHRFEMSMPAYKLADYAPSNVRVNSTTVHPLYNTYTFFNPDIEALDVALQPSSGNQQMQENQLFTYMKTQIVGIKEDGTVVNASKKSQPDGFLNTYETHRLYHVPFEYNISVTNDDEQFKKVTVRVFIVAADDYGDRRKWISLDQFYTSLPAGQREYTITRTSSESSILQQACTEEWPGNWEGLQDNARPYVTDTYCKCGLPRNLLLPRGTKEGMPFRLAVIVSDSKFDVIQYGDGQSTCCDGNIYCGTYNKPYPYKMDMGFPFNRAIQTQGDNLDEKMDVFLNAPNVSKSTVTIKWDTPRGMAA